MSVGILDPHNPVFTICPICNSSFKLCGRQKFCSNKCRQKHFYHSFKASNGFRYKKQVKTKPRYKLGSRTRLAGGVIKYNGRYIAHISVGNDVRSKSYSILKLGDRGAKLAASLQRMAWVIELGVWNPRDGDPFEILSYAESFNGNHEYKSAMVDNVQSPWLYDR